MNELQSVMSQSNHFSHCFLSAIKFISSNTPASLLVIHSLICCGVLVIVFLAILFLSCDISVFHNPLVSSCEVLLGSVVLFNLSDKL